MRFEILDALSEPGNPDKPNEDAFGQGEHIAVVLDGATGLGPPLLPGGSDPAWVARLGAERLVAHGSGMSLKDALHAAAADAAAVFARERTRPPSETWETPFASLMAVAPCDGALDAVWFGDCAALVRRPDEETQIVGEAFEKRAREARRVAKFAASVGVPPAAARNRDEFLPALRAARNRVNTEKGGWLFGPDPACADHTATARVAAPAGTFVLLASDGFLAASSDYALYTADGLVTAARTRGLRAIYGQVRAVEAGDREGVRFPRFKSNDDATAVLLRIAR